MTKIPTLTPQLSLAFAGYTARELADAGLPLADLFALAAEEARELGARLIVTATDAAKAIGKRGVKAASAFARGLGALFVAAPSGRRAAVDAAGYKSGRSKAGDGQLPGATLAARGYQAPARGPAVAGMRAVSERTPDVAVSMPPRDLSVVSRVFHG